VPRETKKQTLRRLEGKKHDRRPAYSRKRCNICGRFCDKDGRCLKVSPGYFEPAEHF
jgi:hypothetical protein